MAIGRDWPDDELTDDDGSSGPGSFIVRAWDRLEAFLSQPRRSDLAALAVLLLVSSAVIFKLSIRDFWLGRTDLLTQYILWYGWLGDQLRNGILPGWSPFNASGLPFAGDPQSGWMYFPIMFWFTLLPPVEATKALAATQIVIAGLGSYAFARLIGLRPVAGLAGALGFALGANVYQNTYCCNLYSMNAPWIPVSLLGIELGAGAGSPRRRVAGWLIAGFAISQMFAAWIGQGVYNGLLIAGAYTFYRTIISPPGGGNPAARERIVRCLAIGIPILLFGLGLAAAGVLPRLDALRDSPISGAAYETVIARGDDRGWSVSYLIDQLFDSDRPASAELNRRHYLGGIVAALALAAPFMARRRFAAPFFTFVTAAMLMLVTRETPLHRLFYLLPRFQQLHEYAPARVLGLFYFFPAILAAVAIASLRDWSRRRWLWPAALLPMFLLFALDRDRLGVVVRIGSPSLASAFFVTAILLLAIFTTWFSARRTARSNERIFTLLRLLLLLGILWDPIGRQLFRDDITGRPTPEARAIAIERALSTTDPGGAGEFLQQRLAESPAPFRYLGYDGYLLRTLNPTTNDVLTYQSRVREPLIQALLVSGRAVPLGLYDIQGYNPAQYQPYVDYQLVMNQGIAQNHHDTNLLSAGIGSPLIDLLNVQYIVVPREVPPGRPDLLRLSQRHQTVFTNELIRVLHNPGAAPHAWIVHETLVASRNEALARLDRREVDPLVTGMIEEEIAGFVPSPAGVDAIRFDRYEANQIDLSIESEHGGLLILNELNARGWNAYLDGERVEIHTVNGIQRGVVVPAGESRLSFRYEPLSLRAGVAISALTAFAMLSICFWLLWPSLPLRRRERSSAISDQ